jgi:hypothetical protein
VNESYQLKGKKQKITCTPATCPDGATTASEGHEGGQTFMSITENNLTINFNQ